MSAERQAFCMLLSSSATDAPGVTRVIWTEIKNKVGSAAVASFLSHALTQCEC